MCFCVREARERDSSVFLTFSDVFIGGVRGVTPPNMLVIAKKLLKSQSCCSRFSIPLVKVFSVAFFL